MSRPCSQPAFRPLPGKTTTDYEPSYELGATYVSAAHRRAQHLVADVPGWLRAEDASKLYELAYWATGPILEIGTYRGKSGTLMALATGDAASGAVVVSVDVDARAQAAAAAAATAAGVGDRLWLMRGSARALLAANPKFTPSLVFVDGDHSFAGVRRDLEALEAHVPRGGLVLMHDYLDPRNDDPCDEDIRVARATQASWVSTHCEFAGVFGACGLFRRIEGGREHSSVGAFDLRRYDGVRLQYLQRARWPVERALRRLLGRRTILNRRDG